jgi:cysteinyl-tRNA synthetase
MLQLFGLDNLLKTDFSVDSEIQQLFKAREIARKQQDWASADELREQL